MPRRLPAMTSSSMNCPGCHYGTTWADPARPTDPATLDIANKLMAVMPLLKALQASSIVIKGGGMAARGIATSRGLATQATSDAALAARAQVSEGATLWRMGTTGRSAAGEGQFWALDHPFSPEFASRYGIPAENIKGWNFIESATIRPGTDFVTRQAPAVGQNLGGGIEVVVPEWGVILRSFSHLGN